MKTKPTAQHGFTVMEMLLYGSLLIIFLVTLTQIFLALLDVQLESESTSNLEHDARFIVSRLSFDLGRAQTIGSPPLGETSSSLIINVGGSSFTYFVQNNNLFLSIGGVNDLLNSFATKVNQLQFTHVGNPNGKPNLRLTVTLEAKTLRPGGAETKTVQTTLGLR